MKFLTDRYEIAKQINIKGVPVLTVDITHCMKGYEDCYEGSHARIMGGRTERYADLPTRVTVKMFGDEDGNKNRHDTPWLYQRIILSGGSVCLKADFGLSDVDEMVTWSNTRILHPGLPVILYFRGDGVGYLRLMRVGKRVDPHCYTVAVLEDVDD